MRQYNMYYTDAVKKACDDEHIVLNIQQKYSAEFFRNYKFPIEETNEDNVAVLRYLERRGISNKTAEFAGIKQDTSGNIVFEHRDYNGRLVATKYRPNGAARKGEKAKWFWQAEANTCPILYGVDKIDITQPLLIVEGHFDRLACIESGYYNTVSVPNGASGDGWIEFCWEWLTQFEKIIIWADNDAAGKQMSHDVVLRLGAYRCYVVEITEDVSNKLTEAVLNRKIKEDKADANNVLVACGKDIVVDLITNAKDVPEPEIIDLVDCEDFNLEDAMIIPTGFKELDRGIHGYVEGTLNIWTGFTGSGKSTTAIQSAIIGGLEAGQSIFCYSGELTKGQLKNWVFMPLAGKNHVVEWKSAKGDAKGYSITKEAKEYIETFYHGRMMIYDNFLDSSPDNIIEKMQYTYMKFGTKIFVIDNLMCIDIGDDNDKQKDFIKSLVKYATKYMWIVHLIAHPRKPGMDRQDASAYDILGSSAIPNLAHRIFWVSRIDKSKHPEETCDGQIMVYKDRLLGVYNLKAKYHYSTQTRRIYGENEPDDIKYEWERTAKIQYPIDIQRRLASCNEPDNVERQFE